jgi:hypothetical protein
MVRSKFRLLGGGQEFQEQDPWADLPDDLWGGPPPDTQPGTRGPGQDIPGFPDMAATLGSRPSRSLLNQLSEPWRTLMWGIQQKGNITQSAGSVTTQPKLIRPAESRSYLLLQNTSTANNLLVAFGYQPQIVTGGATGFLLVPNGSIEPKITPQQDIWVAAVSGTALWVLGVCCD